MGQYFKAVNVTKREIVDPWEIGGGAKLWEWCANHKAGIFPYLLRKSSGTGGGDLDGRTRQVEVTELPNLGSFLRAATTREGAPCSTGGTYAGRWAGDEIYLIGDYDESNLYEEATNHYRDISEELVEEYNRFIELSSLKLGER